MRVLSEVERAMQVETIASNRAVARVVNTGITDWEMVGTDWVAIRKIRYEGMHGNNDLRGQC